MDKAISRRSRPAPSKTRSRRRGHSAPAATMAHAVAHATLCCGGGLPPPPPTPGGGGGGGGGVGTGLPDLPEFLIQPGYAKAVAALGPAALRLPRCPLQHLFVNYESRGTRTDAPSIDRVVFSGPTVPPPVYWRVQAQMLPPVEGAAVQKTPVVSPSKCARVGAYMPPPPSTAAAAELNAGSAAGNAVLESPSQAQRRDADFRAKLYREGRSRVIAQLRASETASERNSHHHQHHQHESVSRPLFTPAESLVSTPAASTQPAAERRDAKPTTLDAVDLSRIRSPAIEGTAASSGVGAVVTPSSGGALPTPTAVPSVAVGSTSKYAKRAEAEMLKHLMTRVSEERSRADLSADRCRRLETEAAEVRRELEDAKHLTRALQTQLHLTQEHEARAIAAAKRLEQESRGLREEKLVLGRDLEEAEQRLRYLHGQKATDPLGLADQLEKAVEERDASKVRLGELAARLAEEKRVATKQSEDASREQRRLREQVSVLREQLCKIKEERDEASRALLRHRSETLALFESIECQAQAHRQLLTAVVVGDEGRARSRWAERESVVRGHLKGLEATERIACSSMTEDDDDAC